MANNELTNLERETQIDFNEADKTAEIQTYNTALKRKLIDLCESRPDEAKHIRTDQHGGMFCTVPKKWVKVNAGLNLTDEQRAERSERGKTAILATRNSEI